MASRVRTPARIQRGTSSVDSQIETSFPLGYSTPHITLEKMAVTSPPRDKNMETSCHVTGSKSSPMALWGSGQRTLVYLMLARPTGESPFYLRFNPFTYNGIVLRNPARLACSAYWVTLIIIHTVIQLTVKYMNSTLNIEG